MMLKEVTGIIVQQRKRQVPSLLNSVKRNYRVDVTV